MWLCAHYKRQFDDARYCQQVPVIYAIFVSFERVIDRLRSVIQQHALLFWRKHKQSFGGKICWHVNAPSDASSRRSRSFFINRKSATILHIFKRALALQHGGNTRRNQIGSACAGSNPAVRALNKSGRARVVKGFDSNRRITSRRCVLLCVILSTLTQCGDTE